MSLPPGLRLGPYEIVAPLGAGGMGEVYRARDTRLDREVAIKVLPTHVAADPHFRGRFDREARSISQLNHPNICTLFDVGRHENRDYLVMECLDGETLADVLSAHGALPLEDYAARAPAVQAAASRMEHFARVLGELYAQLHDTGEALRWLRAAVDLGCIHYPFLATPRRAARAGTRRPAVPGADGHRASSLGSVSAGQAAPGYVR